MKLLSLHLNRYNQNHFNQKDRKKIFALTWKIFYFQSANSSDSNTSRKLTILYETIVSKTVIYEFPYFLIDEFDKL